MTFPTLSAVKAFLRGAWPFLLAAAVAAILLLTYCEGRKSGTATRDLQRERGNVEALEEKGAADATAADRRRTDDTRLSTETEALKEARNAASDTDRRLARHRCLRAQQAARAANRPAPACH